MFEVMTKGQSDWKHILKKKVWCNALYLLHK